jgi:ATP/maltotriose-dependent transcriptional regulator MalT
LPSPRPPGPILLRTKLGPPPARAGLIPRSRLDAQLEAGAKGRLCLVDAPAGSGKRMPWPSSRGLGHHRPPHPGGAARLLNELADLPCDLVLVLDDYHLVTNAVCHASLGFFVDHLPANVHLIVATRADPPLALARLRASGELVELRIAELGFTSAEAEQLLGQAMGLELTAAQTRRLWERTEGWAAGLYLAGLSLQGRRDPGPFIASFEAGHRHVVDYLGAEVLARQPAALRDFMVRSSILQRLSGPLCDAVLETEGSAELLAELEQANLFLIALDDHRHWYRYHHLFAQLLRVELAGPEPSQSGWMATAALGRNLYLAGQPAEAGAVLGTLSLDHLPTDRQPYAVVNVLAVLSLLAGTQGDEAGAAALAPRAMDVAQARGLGFHPVNAIALIAQARALGRQGALAEAERLLERTLAVVGIDSFQLQHAEALLALVEVCRAGGDEDGARAATEQARRLIGRCTDPGMLPALLERVGRASRPAGGRRPRAAPAGELTERELVVLRLLATRLSQREIARELYVSVNTVRTHVQGIYRKLGVASREEAVAAARDLDLLAGAATRLRNGAAGAGGPA